jgi:gamma-glutamylcyclotransferase (GGCT)/AIG2-like uncharacterized protein YtfP
MNKLYFAYGSNMDFDQMAYRCPGAEYLGVATLPNYELRMDGAGYATVVPAAGKHVQGALWDLSGANETKMDGFEGVSTQCYEKTFVEVKYAGNHTQDTVICNAFGYSDYDPQDQSSYTLEALIYLSLRGPFIHSSFREDYVTKVRNGAAGIGVDRHTMEQLEAIQVIPNANVA